MTEANLAEEPTAGGPVSAAERITSLDAIRGVATLGILPMNALSFGLAAAAYANVSADGVDQPVDWVIGVLTMIFVDQKMMALFSLLFGVGVVVFADRAKAKGRRVVWLSLWRFALLGVIGLLHQRLWEGDVLMLYALSAPFVMLVRNLPARLLLVAGVVFALAGNALAPLVQATIGDDGDGLGDYWLTDAGDSSDAVLGWFIADAAGRAFGLMLIGVALFRFGIVQGQRDESFYRKLITWGLGTGTVITSAGIVARLATDWSPDYALTGHIPTGLGTIPMALGYLGLIVLWNRRASAAEETGAGGRSRFFTVERFRSVGRMALTNYLTQTIVGVVTLTWWLSDVVDLSRTMIAAWIVAVWCLQLVWSPWWLARFRYGPFEWAWRCATYRRLQPLRW
jgi:uncharacterized protein